MSAQDISMVWNTFLGSEDFHYGQEIVRDDKGTIYVIGESGGSWGNPIRSHSWRGFDVFVAAVDKSGKLLWNTFLGSDSENWGRGIGLDGDGNIYVVGSSETSWGVPIRSYSGKWDIFIAALDKGGHLRWHTFLGSGGDDWGMGIDLDSRGNIYVTGYGDEPWEDSTHSHNGRNDLLVASLNGNGFLRWHTYLGSEDDDFGMDIVSDGGSNVVVTGYCEESWGDPIYPYRGDRDALAAVLDRNGHLRWHTFLGGTVDDRAESVVLDGEGSIYLTGSSDDSWGTPIDPHSGGRDVLVAKLDSSGYLRWHTFLGGADYDQAESIVQDGKGGIYLTGSSDGSWGTPVYPHSGDRDVLVAKLGSSGYLRWHTFLGSESEDTGMGIEIDGENSVYLTGYGYLGWGSPINPNTEYLTDIFLAKLEPTRSYVVNSRVLGGPGRVIPENQQVQSGEEAQIDIIVDDPEYYIHSITDNGEPVEVANPYIIRHADWDHEVVVTLDNQYYPPTIELSGVRRSEQSWIIQRDYGVVHMDIKEQEVHPVEVAAYILYRLHGDVRFKLVEYFKPGTHLFIDKYLESDELYGYQVIAVDEASSVVAESEVIVI